MPRDDTQDRPSLSVTEAAIVDFQNQREAMAKRMHAAGIAQPPADPDTITDYDRSLYGRPVRIEVDVCIPLDELKKTLNEIRAELTNALIDLERGGPAHDRRFAVHRHLSRAKTFVYYRRQEIKLRGKAQDKQPT